MAMLNNQRVIIHNLYIHPQMQKSNCLPSSSTVVMFFLDQALHLRTFQPLKVGCGWIKKVETMEKNVEESPWKPVKFLAFN